MSEPQASDKMKGILTDVTKCIGCERCVEGCIRQNKLPRDFLAPFKANDGLSARRYTSIVKIKDSKNSSWRMVRKQCMHCLEPSCAAACLVGAFTKGPDGPVVYDASKCIGCRYCMLACPFMIPRYEYDSPLPYIQKCKMDESCRVDGGQPACVDACPTGATIFGTREHLIKEARRRIEEKPDRYINHIYGEHEFGGTSVLYLSDISLNKVLKIPSKEELEKRAVPSLVTGSLPKLLSNWVLVTPVQALTVSGLLTGIWFLRRRQKLMKEKAVETAVPLGPDAVNESDKKEGE